MLWQIFVVLLLIVIVLRRIINRKLINLHKQVKCDLLSIPLLGHAYIFLGGGEGQLRGLLKMGQQALKNNGIASCWLGGDLMVVISDAEIAELTLKKCLEKADFMKYTRFVIGNGSIFAPVPVWRPRRKILLPVFSPKNLATFVKVFASNTDIMVKKLRPKVGTGPFPMWSFLTNYAMDSICESTLGVNVHAQEDGNHPFPRMFDEGTHLVTTRILSPWQHSDAVFRLLPAYHKLSKIRDYFNTFVNQIIKEKRKEIQVEKENLRRGKVNTSDTQNGVKSFLQLLIEASGGDRGYSDVELLEETMVLIFGGTDTSAVGIAFTTLMLAKHPEVQEKVYQELQDIFGESDRAVEAEDLPRLKYLDAVVRETLRLCPPAPVIVREVDSDLTLPSGVTLVKGTIAMTHIWAINRNPKYWGPDAEEYRPERFLNLTLTHPAQFMSFSYGPRNCVGYQYAMNSAKTVLATLLRHYRFVPMPEAPGQQQRLKFAIMMKDVDNFMVQIESRAQNTNISTSTEDSLRKII